MSEMENRYNSKNVAQKLCSLTSSKGSCKISLRISPFFCFDRQEVSKKSEVETPGPAAKKVRTACRVVTVTHRLLNGTHLTSKISWR